MQLTLRQELQIKSGKAKSAIEAQDAEKLEKEISAEVDRILTLFNTSITKTIEGGEKSFLLIRRIDNYKPEVIQRLKGHFAQPEIDLTVYIVDEKDTQEGGEVIDTWEELWVSWEELEGE